jgi:hypothetical protein
VAADGPISSEEVMAGDGNGHREDPEQLLVTGTPVTAG